MCWQLRPFQNWLYQSICSLSRTQLESERSLSVWNHGLWSTMSLVLSILRQWFYIHFRSSKATLCTPRQCTLAFPLIYTISCHRLCCTWLGTLPNCSLNEQNNKVLSLLLLFWCFFVVVVFAFPSSFPQGSLVHLTVSMAQPVSWLTWVGPLVVTWNPHSLWLCFTSYIFFFCSSSPALITAENCF